ncbi:MAG: hypothetical protein EB045_05000 [Actinobacteria bacterium]|nr:hypothetical protein [Actinomycetota bacterium]
MKVWRWWAKALGEKASKCDKESYDTGTIINQLKSTFTMKYQVKYLKPKKKTYSKQIATFYTIEDATLWEKYIQTQGCKESEIIVLIKS